MPSYKIHITGSVFKTGFRYYLKAKASVIGIRGIVYYTGRSSVEVIASGDREATNNFLKLCMEGNQLFHISNIEITEIADREFSSFEVEDDILEDNTSTTTIINNPKP